MKRCPNCGNTVFAVGMQFLNSTVDFVDNEIVFSSPNGEVPHKQCRCMSCGTCYNFDDKNNVELFANQKQTCVKCGREVSPEETDSNGLCIICQAKEKFPELSNLDNADPETLFKALAISRLENLSLREGNSDMSGNNEKKRKPRKKKTEEQPSENDIVDIDDENETQSDVEISEDVAPDMPQEVVDMSNALNPPQEG